jgi:hypothetical protein
MTLETGELVCGDLRFARPLEQGAWFYLQVLGSLLCSQPFNLHSRSPIPDASPVASRQISSFF